MHIGFSWRRHQVKPTTIDDTSVSTCTYHRDATSYVLIHGSLDRYPSKLVDHMRLILYSEVY